MYIVKYFPPHLHINGLNYKLSFHKKIEFKYYKFIDDYDEWGIYNEHYLQLPFIRIWWETRYKE